MIGSKERFINDGEGADEHDAYKGIANEGTDDKSDEIVKMDEMDEMMIHCDLDLTVVHSFCWYLHLNR